MENGGRKRRTEINGTASILGSCKIVDFLGKPAGFGSVRIENDSVLRFSWIHHSDKGVNEERSNYLDLEERYLQRLKDGWVFRAEASAPLIVANRDLGYKLHIDLEDFVYFYDRESRSYQCRYLGYYYFREMLPEKKSEIRVIEKNRKRAFYNSELHFCRSLYDNELKENGYIVVRDRDHDYTNRISFPLNEHIQYADGVAYLRNCEGTRLRIVYNYDVTGKPVDLTKRKAMFQAESGMLINHDSCVIRNDGTLFNYSLLFSEEMGKKRVASSLPSDFRLE